jgi:hypothetical protein
MLRSFFLITTRMPCPKNALFLQFIQMLRRRSTFLLYYIITMSKAILHLLLVIDGCSTEYLRHFTVELLTMSYTVPTSRILKDVAFKTN